MAGSLNGRRDTTLEEVCGESGDVSGATVTSWKERLPEILRGYDEENIFNLDETGCFWRALPSHGFGERGKKCHGGKKTKQRFTIAFFSKCCWCQRKANRNLEYKMF